MFSVQDSFWSELLAELKFIGKFGENEKPVRKYPKPPEPEEPSNEPYSNNSIYSNNYGYEKK